MSLVNKSLQELEARRGDEPLANYAAASVRLGYNDKDRGARKALLAGIVLALSAVGIYLLQTPEKQPATTALTNSAASDLTTTAPERTKTIGTPTTSSQIAKSAPLEAAAVETEPTQHPETSNKTIALLLSSANMALAADRLTTPETNSAKSFYEQVLVLQPGNPEAMAGLAAIADRYVQLAQNQRQQNQYSKALALIQQGLGVSPGNAQLLSLQQTIESERQAEAKKVAAAPINNISETPSKLRVQPSSANTDAQLASAAQSKVDSGDVRGAIHDLENLSQTGHIGQQSAALLAELYLQQQRPQDAVNLASQPEVLPEVQAAYIIARAQVQTGNLAGALATLESQTPSFGQHPEYYALMAGIYQQGGQYRQAIAIYKQLSLLQPDVYTHWLGLAASLDNLREPTALSAFRKVLPMIPEQQTELRQYVQQRLALLTNQ